MEQVEELCEPIAILDCGKVGGGGRVQDVRRSTGRQVVRVAVEGDSEMAWLGTLDGVVITRRGQDYVEAEVAHGHDAEAILQAALERGCRVRHFEITDPDRKSVV